MQKMKTKLPCPACGAYKHWWRECPHGPSPGRAGASAEAGRKKKVYEVSLDAIFFKLTQLVLLADTACARSVAGAKWFSAYRTECLARWNWDPPVGDALETFRFGPGKRIESRQYAIVAVPIGDKMGFLYINIVTEPVPALLASGSPVHPTGRIPGLLWRQLPERWR